MTAVSIPTFVGLLGAMVTVGAYLALQLGRLRGQGYYYAGLNAIGAGLVLVSMADAFNLSSAIMQGIWISVSVIGITRYHILSHTSRLNPEEQEFVETTVPGLGRIEARRLLDLAHWGDSEAGMQLTEQGRKNENIYYLLNGRAEVRADGLLLADLGEHTFVGDISLVTGDAATATVEVTEPARYLAFPVEPLNKLLHQDTEIRRHLKAALSGHLVGKLLRTSRDLIGERQQPAG